MKVDIFGLGTLFYFVLSKGTHPFGNRFKRNGNIVDGVFELDQVAPHPAAARARCSWSGGGGSGSNCLFFVACARRPNELRPKRGLVCLTAAAAGCQVKHLPEAYHLIASMITYDPSKRPTTGQVATKETLSKKRLQTAFTARSRMRRRRRRRRRRKRRSGSRNRSSSNSVQLVPR